MRTTIALLACALWLSACGGASPHPPRRVFAGPAPRLRERHPCPALAGFDCSSLTVPLDYAGETPATLQLAVGVQRGSPAPHGVLLFLTGGPGQPGVPLIRRVRLHLAAVARGYRLVMFDQRGTGAGALRCPALQAAAGGSDLVVPPSGAVSACARAIGPARRFFTTAETVADIERLRRALGVARLTIDGVSYGTYVAERYALTYPRRVARLVLDSVVPQTGVDATYLAALQGTGRVLRDACEAQRCGFDPARDLSAVVRAHGDGPALLDALVSESLVFPSFGGVPALLHAAAAGRVGGLDAFVSQVRSDESAPASFLSQGLHQSTLCLDLASPWRPAAPSAQRRATLARVVAHLSARDVFPFDRATALRNGLAVGCLQWPATIPPKVSDGNPDASLPPVPVLLLAGTHDLSTPLAWARAEAAKAPGAQLVVVPGAGHSLQSRAPAAVRAALARFLSG